MIDITLDFTPEQAAMPFRQAGLVVEQREMQFTFPTHGSDTETVVLNVWIVENPHNGLPERLDVIFRDYIEQKKQEIFLQEDNKLKIINLFSK